MALKIRRTKEKKNTKSLFDGMNLLLLCQDKLFVGIKIYRVERRKAKSLC